MTCNGHNHPPNCNCGFTGKPRPYGFASQIPPATLFGDLAPVARRPRSPKARRCRYCGAMVQVSVGRRGGYYILTADGSKLEHNCPKRVPRRPLSYQKPPSALRWFEATIRSLRRSALGQILEISSLAEAEPITVTVDAAVSINPRLPVSYRSQPGDPVVEIGYFASDGVTLISVIYAYRVERRRRK